MSVLGFLRDIADNWRSAATVSEEPFWRKKGYDDDADHRRAESGLNRMGDRFQTHPRDYFGKRWSSISQRTWKHHPKADAPEEIIEGSTHARIADYMEARRERHLDEA